ncbi:DUF1289 domain-containing protein [Polynucleobacter sp. MWH-Berg-3C6]|jgi:predicted Fe-S protein YdhL (DUF1289 family)|uniref:DUF1289 domain-containing protein n=1 Tax=Polynucleobacter sp. MWH-Berg-3C6 TaxID=1855882 RepID=UPI001C0C6F4A|nr:DUF1289 domain-containing protein [Polynucleobacter sp. MWH-Berg-3C6]MBU3550413.1 DUF1289 domain-containing protein [Polynucleobacter sp. MWH-Berg-3C6]
MNSDSVNPQTQDGSHSLSTGDDASDSPCIGVCTTLYDEICQGCGRTLSEVSNWVFLSDEEKLSVWKRIREDGTAMRFQRQAKENKPA